MTISIKVYTDPPELFVHLHNLIRSAFPEYSIVQGEDPNHSESLIITSQARGDHWSFSGRVCARGYETELQLKSNELIGPNRPLSYHAQIFLYRLLCLHTGEIFNSYGILTGVRPVKIVHRLMDLGLADHDIKTILEQDYLISPEKSGLLLEVASANRPYLVAREQALNHISLYIGVPFCPSRCYYCSFPAAEVRDYARQVSPFVDALAQEMNIIGQYVAGSDLQIQSIYVGGGTPTILAKADLDRIFTILHRYFLSSSTSEITVEAGRPDTLSYDNLSWLKQAGTTRLCINPQTMQDCTLQLIGRHHDREMVSQSMAWARSAGFTQINMDLIAGLPGESATDFLQSVQQVLDLAPENITIHTLAMKKGSRAVEREGRPRSYVQARDVETALREADQQIRDNSYWPYYLYRQKYMKASMENIGYSLPDKICLYNVQMMEERQTIIGVGGGASSKFVNPNGWKVATIHSPKDPLVYQRGVEDLAAAKVDKLRALI